MPTNVPPLSSNINLISLWKGEAEKVDTDMNFDENDKVQSEEIFDELALKCVSGTNRKKISHESDGIPYHDVLTRFIVENWHSPKMFEGYCGPTTGALPMDKSQRLQDEYFWNPANGFANVDRSVEQVWKRSKSFGWLSILPMWK